MTSDPIRSTKKSLTNCGRRAFLRVLSTGIAVVAMRAQGMAAASPSGADQSPIGSKTDPKLAAYDNMMNEFMRTYQPPGAALAVSRDGRLVYARGFGLADVERKEPVHPLSLFRIASISKPFTATAVLQLIQQGKLHFDDKVFAIIKLKPFLEAGAHLDERIHAVTVRQCLQHTGGWDRDKSFDPMSAETAEAVSHALRVPLPIRPEHIIRYTMGRPLDWAPGTKYAYSNFGYCLLGRVIEAASHMPYHDYVAKYVLAPLEITRMRLGKDLLADRAPGEVEYYDSKHRTGRAISGANIGRQVPLPYGVECIETMDANGGWIASPIMLVRFADAFNDVKTSSLLDQKSIRSMLARPPGAPGQENGKPADTYYGCGWEVRPSTAQPEKYTKWHNGALSGSSTLLVSREDGLNWAAVFNSDTDHAGKDFASSIDPLLHQVADGIKDWQTGNLYARFRL